MPTFTCAPPATRAGARSRRRSASGRCASARLRPGRNLPVRTSTVFRPSLRAGDVRLDVVADHPRQLRLGVERLERRREVRRARLAEHGRLDPGGVLEPRDEGARVEQRPAGSATSGSGAGSRARRRARARRTRARGSCTRRRARLLVSSAPPRSTASAPSPTSSMPSRSATIASIVSASTRLPASAAAAAAASSAAPRRRARSRSAELRGELRARPASCCS